MVQSTRIPLWRSHIFDISVRLLAFTCPLQHPEMFSSACTAYIDRDVHTRRSVHLDQHPPQNRNLLRFAERETLPRLPDV